MISYKIDFLTNHLYFPDTEEGYVRITGFTDDAPENVIKILKVGDRIISVDSSLGNKMWAVSNVEGVVSAVTTRLPGQPVQIRFERVVDESTEFRDISSLASVKGVKKGIAKKSLTSGLLSSYSKFSEEVDRSEAGDLLIRCQSVLNRYISVHDKSTERNAGVLALVADRVMESLADASASLDAKTLSLVMNAYIACDQPERALKAFEAAVGLNADGSPGSPKTKIAGKKSKDKIVPSLSGLNLYTVTDAIRAHASVGDSFAARRVLAAIEGAYTTIDGVQSHYWGDHLKADTKCYNTVLAAVVNANDIIVAEEVFDQMSPTNRRTSDRPKKNSVSYNIMIGAYARSGRREDAFDLFKGMNAAGLKPDKVTITALIKAVIMDGDFDTARSLLGDMKRGGIVADVITYNTVIRALCERLRWFEAKELVAVMETNGVNPDGKTYGLLMNGLLKLNKPGPCLTLFESACADQRTAGLMENVKLYTTAITAAASIGDSDRAFELVSRMNFAGVKPNMKTLTALMGACISDNKHSNAVEIFKKMKVPDGYAKSLCIKAYCGLSDFETALNMIEDDDLSGRETMTSYNYMMGCALNESDFKTALSTMVCSYSF
jgi:pentatricopeptide repeat protein